MRISNYPTDTITGSEMILASNYDTATQKYATVNFTADTLKTYVLGALGGTSNSVLFEGSTDNDIETTLTTVDPTGSDKTIYLPNATGYLPVLAVPSTTVVTATPEELNILDTVTSTAAELNLLDGSTAGTIVNSKGVVYGSSGEVNATTLQIAGTSITSTAAELNILDGVTTTAAEINIIDGATVTKDEINILDASAGNTAITSDVATSSGNVASGADHYKLSHTLTLNAALADDAEHADITITNNKVLATSVVLANTSVNANIDVHTVVAGSFKIRITNKSGGNLNDDSTMVINYRVL